MRSEKSGNKIDSRFIYEDLPKWRQGQKQYLWGTELISILPTSKSPTLYEFELPTGSAILFGNLSGFYVKGHFQYKEANAADSTFTTVPASHSAEVALVPNWFEHLLKDPQLYHGNMPLNPHDVPRYSDAFLNSYLYANMYDETKLCLMPENIAPGRCVGKKATDFSLTDEKSEWQKYAKNVFGKRKLEFRYLPMHTFPFMQQTNFCTDGRPPAALPLQVLQKMSIQLQFKEVQDCIFLKPATNTKVYRFNIDSIELVVEEARINPYLEKLVSQKGKVYFSGLTKYATTENITTSVGQHRLRFQDVLFPEGLFICALPKTALSGNYVSSDVSAKVFKNHNIERIDIHFNNMPIAIKSPNYGDVNLHVIEMKQMLDHFEHPPFGVIQDLSNFDISNFREGGKNTAFPHIYIPLCPSGRETRIVPIGGDGQTINKNGDFDVHIKFGESGAADATYLAYIFYTDVNMELDFATQTFSPVYKKAKPN